MALAVQGGARLFLPRNHAESFILSNTVRIVYIDEKGDREFLCTAVVLGPREVLTAGHCLRSYPGDLEMNMSRSFVFAEIQGKNGHEGVRRVALEWAAIRYNVNTDISLVRLQGDISSGGSSVPLLSGDCDDPKNLVLAGYGLDERGKYNSEIAILSLSLDHKERLKAFLDVQDPSVRMSPDFKMLLLQKDGKACFGDSGAPIFCKSKGHWALAGVMGSIEGGSAWDPDYGVGICRAESHAVATSISDSLQIIQEMRSTFPNEMDEPTQVVVDQTVGLTSN